MRTDCTLEVLWGPRDDPGDYPNALAGGPLPSRLAPTGEMGGTFSVELEDGDKWPPLAAILEMAEDEAPARVLKWKVEKCTLEGPRRRIVLSVDRFDADDRGLEPPTGEV